MTFLNPLVLLGLAAASIPLLLHLLNLRKLRTVEFSTLQFLKELQKTKIRRLKLRQIILLILRILIVVFAVLAFSRPLVKTSLPALGAHVKSSVVILLDNSFSMEASDAGGNRLKQARAAALSIIDALKDGDEAALVLLAEPRGGRSIALSRNFALLREDLAMVKTGYAAASLEDGLRTAQKILQSASNHNKEVYAVTDAQRSIFRRNQDDSLRLFNERTAVFAVPVGASDVADVNLSVDTANVVTRIFALDKPVEIEAVIRNAGKRDAKGVAVALTFNGQRVAQRAADIPAGETRTIAIAAAPHAPGIIQAAVELEPDALEPDNKRHFGFVIADKPRVAVFGDAQQTRFLSLLFAAQHIASVEYHPSQALGGTALQQYDAIITTCEISSSDAARIDGFVRVGGGALIFAHEDNAAVYTAFGLSAAGIQEFDAAQPAQFTTIDKLHPIFEGVFKGTTDANRPAESPKIRKALPVAGGQALIGMNGGAFLAEQRREDGRLLVCAVSPDASWGNFPFTGIFPTLVARSLAYASARESFCRQVRSGEQVTIAPPNRAADGGSYKVLDPSGVETYRQAATLPGGAALPLGVLQQPGVYKIYGQDGKPAAAVAVNPDPAEGNLTFAAHDEFAANIRAVVSPQTPVEVIAETTAVAEGVARARTGSELWKACIVAALLCALAEMLVARATRAETAAA